MVGRGVSVAVRAATAVTGVLVSICRAARGGGGRTARELNKSALSPFPSSYSLSWSLFVAFLVLPKMGVHGG